MANFSDARSWLPPVLPEVSAASLPMTICQDIRALRSRSVAVDRDEAAFYKQPSRRANARRARRGIRGPRVFELSDDDRSPRTSNGSFRRVSMRTS